MNSHIRLSVPPLQLAVLTSSPANPSLSPDGKRLALQRTIQGNVDVWLVDAARGVESRFTFDSASDGYPVWSPDGHQIAFSSIRRGAYDIYVKALTEGVGEEHLIFADGHDKRALSWSQDGKYLLFVSYDQTSGGDLWALPMTGERKPIPVQRTNFSESEGQFSPDGRWIAWVSNESGRNEVYIRRFPTGGERIQISVAGGSQVRWRPDGKEVFFVSPDGHMMAVALATSADGQLTPQRAVQLFPVRLATGANVTGWAAQYSVASDGRFIVDANVGSATQSPLSVMLNWPAALKQR